MHFFFFCMNNIYVKVRKSYTLLTSWMTDCLHQLLNLKSCTLQDPEHIWLSWCWLCYLFWYFYFQINSWGYDLNNKSESWSMNVCDEFWFSRIFCWSLIFELVCRQTAYDTLNSLPIKWTCCNLGLLYVHFYFLFTIHTIVMLRWFSF